MLTVLKILTMLWPFVKEMVFGQKTMSEIVRDNKMRVFLVLIVMSSFMLNAFTITKIVAISREYIALDKKYKALESTRKHPEQNGKEVKQTIITPAAPEVVAREVEKPAVVKKKKTKAKAAAPVHHERYNALKDTFETIRQREEGRAHPDTQP